MSKDRYLSEAALKDKPQKRFTIKIKDASITDKKLADGSITTEKLSDKSITSEKIVDNAIGTAHIKSNAVTSEKLDDQAVLVSKIANEVWEKLKNEYLRLDGRNAMKGTLNLNWHDIHNIKELSSSSSGLGDKIILDGDLYSIRFEEVYADSDEPSTFFLGGLNRGVADFHESELTAKSFKTTDRTNIGLLVNDGSVGLAMTDSDIDGILAQVWNPNHLVPDM